MMTPPSLPSRPPPRLLPLCLALLAGLAPHAGAQPAPAAPARAGDPYAEGVAALRQKDYPRAAAAFLRLPESHPQFLEATVQSGELLAERAGRPDLGLRLVERGYRRAPDQQEAAYAWARVQLLSRTNLSVPARARTHPAAVPAEFSWIAEGPHVADDSKKIPRAKLEADLDYLETMIANGYAYAERRRADWRGALDAVRASLGAETGVNTFRFRLARAMTVFGDPHSALRNSPTNFLPRGYLPFLPVAHTDSRVLALQPDRSAFLNADCPYVTALDGRPLADWLRVAGYDVPQASPQFRWQQTVLSLVRLNYLRGELGLPTNAPARVTLASADGKRTKELSLPVAEQFRAEHDRLSRATNRMIGQIGYLRLAEMEPDKKALDAVNDTMTRFRATRGLVIDVRGNSGGSQDILRALLPYFLPPGSPLRVINVAAYRVPVKFNRAPKEGFLPAYRSLHPATASVWTEAERAGIAEFLRGFTPNWPVTPGQFSEWHVMGIRPETNPKAFHYDRPVVVLSDAECFSATDNFLGAFKGLPGVTLLGTTSGGGSGRMAGYILPNTGVPLTLCQMASFRATGQLYDGAGVEPDVVVEAQAADHLLKGADTVLEAALKRLNKK